MYGRCGSMVCLSTFTINADKTEAIWIASRTSLNKVKSQDCSLVMGAETVTPVDVVRNIGVYLDSELSMKQHVAKVASICFFHLRRLRQVRRRVGKRHHHPFGAGGYHVKTGLLQLGVGGPSPSRHHSKESERRRTAHLRRSISLPIYATCTGIRFAPELNTSCV